MRVDILVRELVLLLSLSGFRVTRYLLASLISALLDVIADGFIFCGVLNGFVSQSLRLSVWENRAPLA
jgi:hypothetical protein